MILTLANVLRPPHDMGGAGLSFCAWKEREERVVGRRLETCKVM